MVFPIKHISEKMENHSDLKFFIGLVIAAFHACLPTVKNATSKANTPAIPNIHQRISIR